MQTEKHGSQLNLRFLRNCNMRLNRAPMAKIRESSRSCYASEQSIVHRKEYIFASPCNKVVDNQTARERICNHVHYLILLQV